MVWQTDTLTQATPTARSVGQRADLLLCGCGHCLLPQLGHQLLLLLGADAGLLGALKGVCGKAQTAAAAAAAKDVVSK